MHCEAVTTTWVLRESMSIADTNPSRPFCIIVSKLSMITDTTRKCNRRNSENYCILFHILIILQWNDKVIKKGFNTKCHVSYEKKYDVVMKNL